MNEVLRSMVRHPGKISENRHFEAIRSLIGMDVWGNTDFIVTYLMNPRGELACPIQSDATPAQIKRFNSTRPLNSGN